MTLLLFATALFLFLFFRLVKHFAKVMIGKQKMRNNLLAMAPMVELLTWLVFVFAGARVLFGEADFFYVMVVVMASVVILAFGWFFFRDYLAGVILKAEKALQPGRHIKTTMVGGRIKSLGLRSMSLVTETGETVNLPYTRLSNEVVKIIPEEDESLPHYLLIPLDAKHNPEEVGQVLEKELAAMPWIIFPLPVIEVVKESGGSFALKLTFYTHIRSQGSLVEAKVKKIINGHG